MSREAQLKSSLSSSSKQQPESITRGERGGVAVAKRPIRKMPEARVRNARKHGELNFGSEREPSFASIIGIAQLSYDHDANL